MTERLGDLDAWFDEQEGEQNSGRLPTVDPLADLRAPDDIAAERRVAEEVGEPSAAIRAYPELFSQRAEANQRQRATEDAPRLRDWLDQPGNTEIARDDVENLTLFERGWRSLVRGAFGRASRYKAYGAQSDYAAALSIPNDPIGAFTYSGARILSSAATGDLLGNEQGRQGDLDVEYGRLAYRAQQEARGWDALSVEDRARLEELATREGQEDWGPFILGPTRRLLPQMVGSFERAADQAAVRADEVWENPFPGMALVPGGPNGSMRLVTTPSERSDARRVLEGGVAAVTQAPGAAVATVGGAGGGYLSFGYEMETGIAYDQMIRSGIAPEIAAERAEQYGAWATAIEFVGETLGIKLSGTGRLATRGILGERVLSAPGSSATGRAMGAVLGTAADQGVEEAAQEYAQIIHQDLARQDQENPGGESRVRWAEVLTPEAIQQILMAGYVGAQGGAGMAAIPAGANFALDTAAAQRAERNARVFEEMTRAAQESLVAQRLPSAFESAVSAATGDSSVFIDADRFVEHFQSAGVSPYAVAEELGVGQERLTQALASHGQVEIPTGVFAARVLRIPAHSPLASHARISPTDATPAEVENANEVLKAEVERIAQETDAVATDNDMGAFVEGKLRELFSAAENEGGYRPEVSRRYAQMAAALPRAMVARARAVDPAYADKLEQDFRTLFAERFDIAGPGRDGGFEGSAELNQRGVGIDAGPVRSERWDPPEGVRMSDRMREIVEMAVNGASNDWIAAGMEVEPNNVRVTLAQAKKKLGGQTPWERGGQGTPAQPEVTTERLVALYNELAAQGYTNRAGPGGDNINTIIAQRTGMNPATVASRLSKHRAAVLEAERAAVREPEPESAAEMRRQWVETQVTRNTVPGGEPGDYHYGFVLSSGRQMYVGIADDGNGAATIDWSFLDRLKNVDEDNPTALYGDGAEKLVASEWRELRIAIRAIFEADMAAYERPAYMFTPQRESNRRSNMTMIAEMGDELGYNLHEDQGSVYLIRPDANIANNGRIQPQEGWEPNFEEPQDYGSQEDADAAQAAFYASVEGAEVSADGPSLSEIARATRQERREAEESRAKAEEDARGNERGAGGELNQEQPLVAVHNTTGRKLLHAIRMGGMAVPSLAVARADIGFDSFGEITLIAPPTMIDPRAGGAARVFDADVYSPRYPQISHKVNERKFSSLIERAPFQEASRDLGFKMSSELDESTTRQNGMDAVLESTVIQLAYAREKGMEVSIPIIDGYREGETRPDYYAVRQDLRERVGSDPEFMQWAEKEFGPAFEGERIFQGWTNSGNARYLPHDLDTVVRVLKRELRDGEGFNYGVGSIRSKVAREFRSLTAIKKARGQIVDSATMEALKNEANDEFVALANRFLEKTGRTSTREQMGFLDTFSEHLKEVAETGRASVMDQYYKEALTAEDKAAAVAFLEKLRSLPTEYFEAKIRRAVGLNEFVAAVVPEGTEQRVIDALQGAGVSNITYYKKGDVQARAAAVMGADASALFQNQTRGSIRYENFRPGEFGSAMIRMGKSSDLSTFLHEFGHLGHLVLESVATDPKAPAEFRAMWDNTLQWWGLTQEQWSALSNEQKTPYFEQWARTFEAYLMEGKAPSLTLREAFAAFKAWLTQIYRTVFRLDANLNPQIRDVFDRMLATDAEMAEARAAMGSDFTLAREAFKTDEEYQTYVQAISDARDAQDAELRARVMDRFVRKEKRWWRSERERVRNTAIIEVDTDPARRALEWIAFNEWRALPVEQNEDGVKLPQDASLAMPEGLPEMRLDMSTLDEADRAGLPAELRPLVNEADAEAALENAMALKRQGRARQPQRLWSFIKAQGGIKDEGGEVVQALGSARGRPGLINNTSGLDADTLALRAWEAGYFGAVPRQTLNQSDGPDAGPARDGFDTERVVYRGLGRPYDAADGGYYQSFTSSLDDAQEYGSNVIAAHIRPGRNLAIDGGGNNFNSLSVQQLPADVRARLHPGVGDAATTDQIAHAAREAGYDSVTVRNVHDNRWGERPGRNTSARTIDFVFDTKNISPLDNVPTQPPRAEAAAERVRLSDADRALLAELEDFPGSTAPDGGPAQAGSGAEVQPLRDSASRFRTDETPIASNEGWQPQDFTPAGGWDSYGGDLMGKGMVRRLGPERAYREIEEIFAQRNFQRQRERVGDFGAWEATRRNIHEAYRQFQAQQRRAGFSVVENPNSTAPDGRPVQAGRDPGTYRDLDLGDGNVVNFRAVESDPMHREIHWDISDVRGYGDDVEALAQQERDIRRRLDFTPGLRSTEEGQALQRQVSEIAARRREAQVSDGAGSKSYVHAFRAVERALNEELSANAGRGVTYEFYPDKAGLQPIYEAWARRFQHPDYRIEKAEVGYRLVPTNSSRAGPNAGPPQGSFENFQSENPIIYHGSAKPLNGIRPILFATPDKPTAAFFARLDRKETRGMRRVTPLQPNFSNPMHVSANGALINAMGTDRELWRLVEQAQAAGNDAIIVHNVVDGPAMDIRSVYAEPIDVYIILDPKKVEKLPADYIDAGPMVQSLLRMFGSFQLFQGDAAIDVIRARVNNAPADVPRNDIPLDQVRVAYPKADAARMSARLADQDGELTTSWGATLQVRAGLDMVVGEAQGEGRPVRKDIFDQTYQEVAGGEFAKRSDVPVGFVTLAAPQTINTLEGPVPAEAGDIVLIGAIGEMWPIRADKFAQRYDVAAQAPMFGDSVGESNAALDTQGRRPTPRELLDALIDDIRNVRQVYSSKDEAAAAAYQNRADALRWFEARGIDLSGSKEDIRAQIKEALQREQEEAGGGWHPDDIAPWFGFSSGDELIQALKGLKPRAVAIEENIERRLEAQYGDPLKDGTVAEAAALAGHIEAQAKRIELELEAIQRATGGRVTPVGRAARAYAERQVQHMTVKQIRGFDTFLAGERRAARAAMEATQKKDFQTAALMKQRQLISFHLYRLARDASEEMDVAQRYFQKFDREGVRKKFLPNGAQHLEQIDQVLEAIDLRRNPYPSQRQRSSFQAYLQDMRDRGIDTDDIVEMDADFLKAIQRRPFATLTLEEARAVQDAVRNFETLGTRWNQVLTDRRNRQLSEVIDGLVDGAAAEYPKRARITPSLATRSRFEQAIDLVMDLHASQTKFEQLVRTMDGLKGNGPWFSVFIPAARAAQSNKNDRHMAAAARMTEILSAFSRRELGRMISKKEWIPQIGDNLTRMQQVAVLLYSGTEYRRAGVMKGFKWNEDQLQTVIFRLTPKEVRLAQDIWALLDSFKDESFDLDYRVRGVRPQADPGIPVQTAHGVVQGSYFPIKFDPDRSRRAAQRSAQEAVEQLSGGSYRQTGTKRGRLKQLVGTAEQAFRLDAISIIAEHIEETVHDLSHREFVIDARRMLASERVRTAISQVMGPWGVRVADAWISKVEQPRPVINGNRMMDRWERAAGKIKNNATIVNMGLKITTALIQELGTLNAIPRTGVIPMLKQKGITIAVDYPVFLAQQTARLFGAPETLPARVQFIFDRSAFMRQRMSNRDRDVRDAMASRLGERPGILPQVPKDAQDSMLILSGLMDMAVAAPTWLAGYETALAGKVPGILEGDEQAAIEHADSIVATTQSGGAPMDLSAILASDNQFWRLATMFMSWSSTFYNQMFVEQIPGVVSGKIPPARFAANMLFIWFVPSLITMWFYGRIEPQEGEDDEERTQRALLETMIYPLQTIPIVRDALNAYVTGYDYQFTPAQAALEAPIKLARAADRGDGEQVLKQGLLSAGYIFGLPSRQMWITGEGVYDIATGEDDLSDPVDTAREVLVRDTR